MSAMTTTTEAVRFDAVELFKREYQAFHRISPERAKQQRKLLYELESRVRPRRLFDVDGGDIQSWAGEWLEQGYHVNTVRKRLNMIRPFYSWAFARSFIDAETYMRVKQVPDPDGASPQGKPRPYSRAELDAFWQELNERLPYLERADYYIGRWLRGTTPWRRLRTHAMRLQIEAIVHLALHCGLRREEIFRLTPDELHYDNAYIVVRGKGKDKPERKVPFTTEAREAVKAWLDFRLMMRPEQYAVTWLSCVGQRFNQPMGWGRFQEILQKQVGEAWTLHRFRHTCGTAWYRESRDLGFVQRLLGHSNISQTLGYAEIVDADVSREMARHEDGFNRHVRRRATA